MRLINAVNIITSLLLLQGCLTDNSTIPLNIEEPQKNIQLLAYLEKTGDYINSNKAPALIEASEVYNNLNNYLIIDVREHSEYIEGHISGAKNISNTELLNYLQNTNLSSYNKIVIVSIDGQSSAYYTCLLRLYGFNNVYSINFGMAYWNWKFAGPWLNNIKDSPNVSSFTGSFIAFPEKTSLPQINPELLTGNIAGKVKDRIASFITRGFVDTVGIYIPGSEYIVCYGMPLLYTFAGHPSNAVFYLESEDLKSVNNLQTLPNDKEILVYDYSGQRSAQVTAYLNVLGYKAKTLLYGTCQLFYGTITGSINQTLRSFSFIPDNIYNYPYATGE